MGKKPRHRQGRAKPDEQAEPTKVERTALPINILQLARTVGRKAILVAFFAALLPAINNYIPSLPKWFADIAAIMSVVIVALGFIWIVYSEKE